MKLWPTKIQWRRWSLPSKLTAIGTLLAVISLGAYTTEKIFQRGTFETDQNVAERGVLLINLGYNLAGFTLVRRQLPAETIDRELEELYVRLGLRIPKAEVGAEMMWATRSMLATERDRHFLDIGRQLILAYGLGTVLIHHKGTNYEVRARGEISDVIRDLQTALISLGILVVIEREREIESYLMPAINTTESSYSQALESLKAKIEGEIRQRYGT